MASNIRTPLQLCHSFGKVTENSRNAGEFCTFFDATAAEMKNTDNA